MQSITFSERPWGTVDPVYDLGGTVVRFDGVITPDGAQPASPAIAGTRLFQGGVFMSFDQSVGSVTLDGGYFNNLRSTQVIFRANDGSVLSTQVNDQFGIQTFAYHSDIGIGSVSILPIAIDESGFSVDTVRIGDIVDGSDAPILSYLGGSEPRDIAGSLSRGTWGLGGSLPADSVGGPADPADVFSFVLDWAGSVSLTIALTSDPSVRDTITFDGRAGINYFEVTAPKSYDAPQGYTLSYSVIPAPDDANAALDAILGTLGSDLSGGIVDLAEVLTDHAREISDFFDRYDDIVKQADLLDDFFEDYASKLKGKLGPLGLLVDAAAIADAARDAYRDTGDWRDGVAAGIGEGASAGVGAVISFGTGIALSGPFTPLGGAAAGLLTGIVYEVALADRVADLGTDLARGLLEDENENRTIRLAYPEAEDAAPYDLVPFDAEWYLDTYADAAAAVTVGDVPSAYLHFITSGLKKGYSPNDSGIVIPRNEVATRLVDHISNAARPEVADSAPGAYGGDVVVRQEMDFAEALNAARPGGADLYVTSALSAIANRIAHDVVYNRAGAGIEQEAAGSLEGGTYTFADGRALWQTTVGTGEFSLDVRIVGTDGIDASGALEAMLAKTGALGKLLDTEMRSIGIAEVAGVWVAVTSMERSDPPAELGTHDGGTRVGTDGADVIVGGVSHDKIRGLDGFDVLYGGTGRDTLKGGQGEDVLRGGSGSDRVSGGQGDDDVSGGRGDDRLSGGGGNDRVVAGGGDDALRGGNGDDWLIAGSGDVAMRGGRGTDIFVFAPGNGTATIFDFDPEAEVIDLTGFGLARFRADVKPLIDEVGRDLWITFEDGEALILRGLDAEDIGRANVLLQ